MAISNTAITTTGNNVFVCPSNQQHAITCMIFCSTGLGSDLTVQLVPSAKTPADNETMIINKLSIPAGETFTFDSEKLILEDGDIVFAKASNGNDLVVSISTMRVN